MTKEQSKSDDPVADLKDRGNSGQIILNEDLTEKATIAQHFERPTEQMPSNTGNDKKKE